MKIHQLTKRDRLFEVKRCLVSWLSTAFFLLKSLFLKASTNKMMAESMIYYYVKKYKGLKEWFLNFSCFCRFDQWFFCSKCGQQESFKWWLSSARKFKNSLTCLELWCDWLGDLISSLSGHFHMVSLGTPYMVPLTSRIARNFNIMACRSKSWKQKMSGLTFTAFYWSKWVIRPALTEGEGK